MISISTFMVGPHTPYRIWSFKVDYIFGSRDFSPPPPTIYRDCFCCGSGRAPLLDYPVKEINLIHIEVKGKDTVFNPFMQAPNPMPLIIVSPNWWMPLLGMNNNLLLVVGHDQQMEYITHFHTRDTLDRYTYSWAPKVMILPIQLAQNAGASHGKWLKWLKKKNIVHFITPYAGIWGLTTSVGIIGKCRDRLHLVWVPSPLLSSLKRCGWFHFANVLIFCKHSQFQSAKTPNSNGVSPLNCISSERV